jgi:hypothetical protein
MGHVQVMNCRGRPATIGSQPMASVDESGGARDSDCAAVRGAAVEVEGVVIETTGCGRRGGRAICQGYRGGRAVEVAVMGLAPARKAINDGVGLRRPALPRRQPHEAVVHIGRAHGERAGRHHHHVRAFVAFSKHVFWFERAFFIHR